MIAKRFKVVQGYNDRYCQDTATNKLLNQNQTVEYLNNLCEENEQLKKQNDNLVNMIARVQYRADLIKEENEQLKQKIKDLRIDVLDSIHEADEIRCNCNPCVVEECVKKVVE